MSMLCVEIFLFCIYFRVYTTLWQSFTPIIPYVLFNSFDIFKTIKINNININKDKPVNELLTDTNINNILFQNLFSLYTSLQSKHYTSLYIIIVWLSDTVCYNMLINHQVLNYRTLLEFYKALLECIDRKHTTADTQQIHCINNLLWKIKNLIKI